METLSRCRICLVSGVRMHLIINTYLQEIFEQLTSVPFQKEDGRPLFVCYICKARLNNCHTMKLNCLRSKEYFIELPNNRIKPTPLQYINKLQIVHPLTNLNCLPVATNNIDDDVGFGVHDVKPEPLDISDVQVKEENIKEDIPIDEADSILNTELEYKFNTEDITIEDEDIIHIVDVNNSLLLQLKSDEQSVEDNIVPDYNAPAAEFKDVCPRNIKVVLNRINLDSVKTSIHVAEKLKLPVENESQFITTYKPEKEVRFKTNKNVKKIKPVKKSTQKMNKDTGKNIPGIATERMDTSGDLQTKIYKCDTCEKYFNRKATLLIHTRIHSGVKPYRCDICGKCFSQQSHLAVHTRIHSGVKPYRCDICEKFFSQPSNLIRHTRIHSVKPYRCDICEKCFSQESHLVTHNLIHTGVKPYRCDICEKYFSKQNHLVQHACIHTGEYPYMCDICKTCFRYRRNLVRHIRKHSGVKPYQCDVCHKCFSDNCNLERHTRIHGGVKPYRCVICDKCFSQQSILVKHARIHIGVKPYQCDVCRKCFSDNSHLVRHTRIHSGVKKLSMYYSRQISVPTHIRSSVLV